MDQKKRIVIGGLIGVVLLAVLIFVWTSGGSAPAVDEAVVDTAAKSAQEQAAETTFTPEEMEVKPRQKPTGIGSP
ncbi:MAG: hypothetical protein K2W85_14375 [Phycisphaerales bacterium]|nr:hypothetical protein [Phycisphaerales bacterium]